ncbi:MAG TPA: hypothetical protein VGH93_03450 [Solirubrobacteraceae bacterium]
MPEESTTPDPVVYVSVGGLIARVTICAIDEARAAAERLAQERA